MTQPNPKPTFANLQTFRHFLSSSAIETVAVKQLTKGAFCLATGTGEDPNSLILGDRTHPSTPRRFNSLEQCARFAITRFGVRLIYFNLIDDEAIEKPREVPPRRTGD